MKQITQQKIKSRSITVFLKKENAGDYEDSIKLVEGISEKPYHTLNGKVVDIKGMELHEIIQTKAHGVSGWHRFSDAFEQVFTNGTNQFEFPNGEQDIYETLDDAFGEAKKALGEVYGMKMRPIQVGDIIKVQEWGYENSGEQVGNPRFFVVSPYCFDEFNRATGEFL